MRKSGCIHPEILGALARCGHGDTVLIADGNYPLESRQPESERVFLGLRAGSPEATEVLSVLLGEINVEGAAVMRPEGGERPEIFDRFAALLGFEPEQEDRYPFYTRAAGAKLAILTGEQRLYANILLTVGTA